MMKYLYALVVITVSLALGAAEARSGGAAFFLGGDFPGASYHRHVLHENAQATADMYDMNTWFDNVVHHCLQVVARR
eukprot:scaffold25100_cov145-Amphora_coffeaeformis.AAC.1